MTTSPSTEQSAPKRRGRRPSTDGKTARMNLRVVPIELAAWQAAADAAGLSLNAWAERAMRAQAARRSR